MKQQILNRFILVLFIAAFGLIIAAPASFYEKTLGPDNFITTQLSAFKISLGLDLQGGTELDYRVDLSEGEAQNADDDADNDVDLEIITESVRDALAKRINPLGVGESIVKRASIFVEGKKEEHILVQMPPDTDIEKAKSDAERDNRLEFFKQDPNLEKKEKIKVAAALSRMDAGTFEERGTSISAGDKAVTYESFGPYFKDEVTDTALAATLFGLEKNTIAKKVIETNINPEYIVKDGTLEFDGVPYARTVYGIAKVTDKVSESREKTTPATANARHILFAYPGASMAGEDVKYKSKEDAQAKATEILNQLQTEGTDNFGDLAKEFSTEGAAQRSFGELGDFGKGQMVAPFEEAIFAMTQPGLVSNLVESDFGFHVIEVKSVSQDKTETLTEDKISYDMIVWDRKDMNWAKTKLGGKQLDIASVGTDSIGKPLVNLRFDKEGGKLFGELTEALAAKTCGDGEPCRLGIKVGGEFITTPTVQQKITGRDAQITGGFTFEEAHDLANGLNLGAIDAPVILSGQTTIQSELGQEQLNKSLRAGTIGLIATMIFMIFLYRLSGVVASISLIIYASLFISVLKFWPENFGGPIVLSLAGAAGVALSIGLAVDGNILIFERMKEEIRKGRSLSQSVDLGFERAWAAIRDSNITTLLICLILVVIGTSIIKGFAVTLIVGTLLSMFTAVTVSRNLLRAILLVPMFQKPFFYGVSESEIGKKVSGAKIRKRKTTKK